MSQRFSHTAFRYSRIVALCLVPAWATMADEQPTAATAEVTELLRQLSAPAFTDRQAASRRLAELGPTAIGALEKAAASPEHEAASRAIEILKQHFQSPDETSKLPAQATLQRLEKSAAVATAQRARDVLNPPRRYAANNGNLPLQRGGMATRTVTTHEANGRREMEIRENDRKVTIQTFPGGRIDFEVNETQNGKNVSRKVQAADLSELKRKDPAAGQLYEQYQALHRVPVNGFFGAGRLPILINPTR
jgi:hypothetical protein